MGQLWKAKGFLDIAEAWRAEALLLSRETFLIHVHKSRDGSISHWNPQNLPPMNPGKTIKCNSQKLIALKEICIFFLWIHATLNVREKIQTLIYFRYYVSYIEPHCLHSWKCFPHLDAEIYFSYATWRKTTRLASMHMDKMSWLIQKPIPIHFRLYCHGHKYNTMMSIRAIAFLFANCTLFLARINGG